MIKKSVVQPEEPKQEKIPEIPEEPMIPAYKDINEKEFFDPVDISRLSKTQYDAIVYMHNKSNIEHNKARAAVQKKARKLGFSAADV